MAKLFCVVAKLFCVVAKLFFHVEKIIYEAEKLFFSLEKTFCVVAKLFYVVVKLFCVVAKLFCGAKKTFFGSDCFSIGEKKCNFFLIFFGLTNNFLAIIVVDFEQIFNCFYKIIFHKVMKYNTIKTQFSRY